MKCYTGSMKTARQMERHLKGVSNHCRIEILLLVNNEPGVTVDGLAKGLKKNFKTVSEHTRRLVYAGLINKTYKGRSVGHTLSPYGKILVKFLQSFRNS